MKRSRVLHVITVYNGRRFVLRAIESALNLDQSEHDIDVLVLDDASPEPGWSEEVRDFCRARGAKYYLTPRNLGIPRNCNLGLLAGMKNGYHYVTINNSDVIFPANLITSMVAGFQNPKMGSVTAWSNNVSIYTLLNSDPDKFLANQDTVNFVSETLRHKFGESILDIPAGISFAIMIPTDVLRHVGINDPIFGRGYCEETDWSLRSLQYGYRLGLSLGTFVYHMGRGSNHAAGLVSGAHTTVPENEDIIDMRYPNFRKQVLDFETAGEMQALKGTAVSSLITQAGLRFGYSVSTTGGGIDDRDGDLDLVRVAAGTGEAANQIEYGYRGFIERVNIPDGDWLGLLHQRFGGAPVSINGRQGATDVGAAHATIAALAKGNISYPVDIW